MYFKNILLLVLLFTILTSGFVFKSDLFSAFVNYGENSTHKVYALKLPDTLRFAGESFDITSPDLRERFDRELLVNTYWQSNMMLLLKRSNKFFPLIERVLKEEGVPIDLKYLALIESSLENVSSPAGAKGFWQIMSTTGRDYGLEINSNVDERYHLEFSTKVAAKFLKKAKEKFGSWALAAAAYNRGINGIQRNLTTQKASDYFDLFLGQETSRYVFRILAVKEIIENPIKYGYVFEEKDLYKHIPVRLHGIDTPINNLASFAKKMVLVNFIVK